MGEESAVMDSIERERANRQREVVAGYHIFASYGWGDDGSGHISTRDPQHTDSFGLLRAGVAFARATLDDLVLVGPDGAIDRHGAAINPAAYCIHAPIHHARRDVVGIAHTHTGYGTPFAALARPLRPTSQEACAFHGDQNVFAGEELNVVDIVVGRRLAAALAGARLLVLSNHGLLTVGATVAQAVGWFVLAERAAEVEVKAGDRARVISDEAAAEVYRSIGPAGAGDEVFRWLCRSRLGAELGPA
jgi:ribulose-5-phosphate 4-epimerase/fuculose-1-phosphate aldolase